MNSAKIPLGRMDHVALPTSDPARGERFYRGVLGFHTVPRPSFSFDGRWLVHDAVGVMLHLIHKENYAPQGGPIDSRGKHFALRCTNIDAAVAVLQEHGVAFVEKKLPDFGYRQLFLQDPDGNVIELGEWPEQ